MCTSTLWPLSYMYIAVTKPFQKKDGFQDFHFQDCQTIQKSILMIISMPLTMCTFSPQLYHPGNREWLKQSKAKNFLKKQPIFINVIKYQRNTNTNIYQSKDVLSVEEKKNSAVQNFKLCNIVQLLRYHVCTMYCLFIF